MKKDERMYLNELSKKCYGKSSKWQKMVNKGELIPAMSKNKKGEDVKVRVISKYTIEEVKSIMEDLVKEEQEAKETENVGESNPEPQQG